jgi:hypothetical protein
MGSTFGRWAWAWASGRLLPLPPILARRRFVIPRRYCPEIQQRTVSRGLHFGASCQGMQCIVTITTAHQLDVPCLLCTKVHPTTTTRARTHTHTQVCGR